MSLSLSAAPRRRRDEVVKSAARVMRILEYFDRRKSCANVHAVATALGYPPSSTGALLRSLAATGYLHHDRANRT
jgi:DNA-binding IclR family transcriptional regulator